VTAEMMAGTPLYIAPEVLNGDPISASSDIYGVGVLLYFLLTGTFPVTGRTLADVRAAHADGLRTPVRARRQDIPQRLAAVIDRATAPAVATRIRSAAELEAALVQPNTAGARVGGRAHWWAAAVMAMTVSAIGGGALAVRSAGGGWPFGPPGIAATQNADLRGPARSPSRAVRLVWTGQDAFGSVRGTISPDGRYLTFVDLATNGLGIRDLFENTSRVLAQGPDSSLFYAVFSPDGQRVAYTWRTWSGGKNEFDVRVLSLNGGDAAKPRVVYKNAEMRWPRVFGWTPDGKQILLLRSLQDGTNQITFVGVDDGSARVLKSIAWNYTTMSLSPDGRFVAYDSVVGNGTSPQEIFVLATDGSRETKVVQGPGVNRSPLWAPDGSRLLFLSTRTGNTALWSVSIQEGKAAGSPELIKADIGDVRLQGITRHGTLHYLVSGASRANVYVAEMDDARKSFLTPAVVSERFINSNSAPAWSPDGRQLAYLSRTPAATALVVRTLATGEERDIALPKEVQTGNLVPAPRWFPDGRSVLVCGFLGNGAGRFYRVDVASGSAEVLHEAKGTSGDGGLGATAIARDGNAFWYIASHAESRGLIRFDIESRQTTVVKSGPFDAVALSADGTQFALATVEADGCHVRVMPSAGGELKDLVRVCSGVNRLGWASNSDVMYVTGGNASPNIVWRVSTNGGEPRQVGISMPAQLMHPEVSPDGRRIAFNIFDTSASEVWALENFLPPLNAKK
jgi:Tol biopolymer transport system component